MDFCKTFCEIFDFFQKSKTAHFLGQFTPRYLFIYFIISIRYRPLSNAIVYRYILGGKGAYGLTITLALTQILHFFLKVDLFLEDFMWIGNDDHRREAW